jgi:outer membrane lipoprotein-sorting protein
MTLTRHKALAWLVSAAALTNAYAADLPDVTLSGVASGAALKIGFEGSGKRVLPETVYLHGSRTRLEFGGGENQPYLLRDGNSIWLINEKAKVAWPLKYSPTARQYVFDTSEPCKSMDVSCEREGKKIIAGREASGWRFRHAGSRGPDGSDSGTLWIDDQYGLLLGYHAEDMQGRPLDWTVTTVSFEQLPAALFELPAGGKRTNKR